MVPEAGSAGAPSGRQRRPDRGGRRNANRRWARRRLPPYPSARPTHGQAALPGTLSGTSRATRRPLPAGCLPPTKSKRTPALRVTSSVSLDPVGLADQRHLLCPWWWRLPLAQRLRGRRKQPDRTVSLAAADAGVHRGAAITQRPPQAAGAAVRDAVPLGHRPRSSAPRRPQCLAGISPPMGRTLYPGKPLVNPQIRSYLYDPGSYVRFITDRAERRPFRLTFCVVWPYAYEHGADTSPAREVARTETFASMG